MYKFIFQKFFYGILVLIGVVFIIFGLFNILPVDPARLTLGQRADVESVEAINKELGLDKPKAVQFALYLNDLSPVAVHEKTAEAQKKYGYSALFSVGKEKALVLKKPYLRRSYQTKEDVLEILKRALPQTILLAVAAMILASVIGIVLGVIAAVKQHSWFDTIAMSVSVLGISVPSYFAAIVLGYFFGIVLHDITGLDQTGGLTIIDDYGNEVLAYKNLILPSIALGSRPIGIIFQLTRSAMLDVLSQDYIRTARAKGLAYPAVLFKHALRNAMNPVVTTISGWFASLLAGAFFVEVIFDIKGLGYTAVDALQKFDFPVAMGTVLFTATVFIVISFLVDILYAILDPRIRIGKG
ncbi:MAG TPA: ABC transporter permease [Chitinophagales bacterium]|nr:ABC transporter permease [Chitinophagales bacterium]HQD12898.1 ABC transporter permease [Chitinophagales bacterium]HQO32943.1 ABC transporter permease [Chitinophagales bacterium]HQO90182.1 ABC transporter permease [Chitinophagales bacterium]